MPPSPSRAPSQSPNHLKRKDRSDDSPPQQEEEYEAGRVICQVCGIGIAFRDESTNQFTMKHWDAHRLACSSSAPRSAPPPPPSAETVIYTPETTAQALAHPPTKRRRAKRTEEERIEYLKSDPYVSEFEAYRVLCASCDKWIRLRPNSTYCSIPWDAHRKSCLAKKINNKNVYALEERNTLFSNDPDVRKFDPERLLCNMCDKWMNVPPDDHLQAVQKWLQHRASCQKIASSSTSMSHTEVPPFLPPPSSPPPSTNETKTPLISASLHRASFSSSNPPSPSSPKSPHISTLQPRFLPPEPLSSFHDLNPANFAPAHESRRRNAEQRAATLRADRLIGQVEPNRVFCSLCQKWVQLRQDSSYCAYPWLQHRGKCLARHQRRNLKATEMVEVKSRKHPHDEDELMSDRERAGGGGGGGGIGLSDDPESEEGMDSQAEEDRIRRKEAKRIELRRNHEDHFRTTASASKHHHYHYHHQKSRSVPFISPSSTGAQRYAAGGANGMMAPALPFYRQHHEGRGGGGGGGGSGPSQNIRTVRPWDEELDAEGELDVDADYLDDDRAPPPPRSLNRSTSRRPWPIGLADLDSPSGRKQFIFGSVEYLFATTYESTDDMSISALLAYLNAAMPQDKHEDFDTSEVARAVAAMKEKGRVIFEGDMLRLAD